MPWRALGLLRARFLVQSRTLRFRVCAWLCLNVVDQLPRYKSKGLVKLPGPGLRC